MYDVDSLIESYFVRAEEVINGRRYSSAMHCWIGEWHILGTTVSIVPFSSLCMLFQFHRKEVVAMRSGRCEVLKKRRGIQKHMKYLLVANRIHRISGSGRSRPLWKATLVGS